MQLLFGVAFTGLLIEPLTIFLELLPIRAELNVKKVVLLRRYNHDWHVTRVLRYGQEQFFGRSLKRSRTVDVNAEPSQGQ